MNGSVLIRIQIRGENCFHTIQFRLRKEGSVSSAFSIGIRNKPSQRKIGLTRRCWGIVSCDQPQEKIYSQIDVGSAVQIKAKMIHWRRLFISKEYS